MDDQESDSTAAGHGSATNLGLCIPAAEQTTTFDGPLETQPTAGPRAAIQTDRSSNGSTDGAGAEYSEMMQQSMIFAPEIGAREDIAHGIVDGFSAQAMELLSINWLSPDYQAGLAWSEQLADMQDIFPAGCVGFPPSLAHAPEGCIDQASRDDQQSVTNQPTIPSPCRDRETVFIHSDQSPAVSHVSGHSCNRFYVNGDGARASLRPPLPTDASSSHCVSDTHEHPSPAAEREQATSAEGQFPLELYRVVSENLQAESSKFTGNELPSYDQVSCWVRLYLEYFHSTFPFLRQLELFDGNTDWVLVLAVATVGAFLSTSSEAGRIRHPLMETLEQVVTHRLDSVQSRQNIENDWMLPAAARREGSGDLAILQATVLTTICLLHCGRKDKISSAMTARHRLVDACHSMQLLSAPPPQYLNGSAEDPRRWCRIWYKTQASIRLGLMIWASHPVESKVLLDEVNSPLALGLCNRMRISLLATIAACRCCGSIAMRRSCMGQQYSGPEGFEWYNKRYVPLSVDVLCPYSLMSINGRLTWFSNFATRSRDFVYRKETHAWHQRVRKAIADIRHLQEDQGSLPTEPIPTHRLVSIR